MSRLGHASPDAALRYQHATADRDVVLAHALSKLAEGAELNQFPHGARDIRGMNAESVAGASERARPLPAHTERAGDGNRTRVLSLGS